MSEQLTIAIPTYNRPEKARRQVLDLLPQVRGRDVRILIIDNNSDPAPRFDDLDETQPTLRVLRNRCNIGLGGNILRCIEEADGEWIWILGDDDPVLHNALDTILQASSNASEESAVLKFGAIPNYPHVPAQESVASFHDLAQRCRDAWFFSSLLFISTSVFRRKRLIPHMASGYHWNYSIAPHLALLFCAMRDGATMQILPANLVHQADRDTIGNNWNSLRLTMGTMSLGEIEGCEDFASISLPGIIRCWSGKSWFTAMTAQVLRSGDKPASYWKSCFLRRASFASGIQKCYLLAMALFFIPLLKWKVIRKSLHRITGTRSDNVGLDRS